jgi:hypothetical protein
MPDQEFSESGAPIVRYEARERDFEFAHGDEESIDKITEHIEKHIGKIDSVFHEIVSDLVHIDIHIVKPTQERNFYTLVTSGMSDRPMNTPAVVKGKGFEYAELIVCLPPDGPIEQSDENSYWPIRWLKTLSRFPHEYNTWIWYDHTIPNGAELQPYADNTLLCCMLLTAPETLPMDFIKLKVNDNKTINFIAVVPIYKDETDFKLKAGSAKLTNLFAANNVTELLDIHRKSVVPAAGPTKKSWWPFG